MASNTTITIHINEMSLTHEITPELFGDIQSQDANIREFDFTIPGMEESLADRDARNAQNSAKRKAAIDHRDKLASTGKYSAEDLRKDPHLRVVRRQERDEAYTNACRARSSEPVVLKIVGDVDSSFSEIQNALSTMSRDSRLGNSLRLQAFQVLSGMLKFEGSVKFIKCETICSCCSWVNKETVKTDVGMMNYNCYSYGDYQYHRERARNLMKFVARGIFNCVPELHETGVAHPEDYMTALGLFILNKFNASTFFDMFSSFDLFVTSEVFTQWFTSLFL